MNRRNFFKGILGAVGAAAALPFAGKVATEDHPVQGMLGNYNAQNDRESFIPLAERGLGPRVPRVVIYDTIDGVKTAVYSSLTGWYAQDDSVKPTVLTRGKRV